MEIDPLGDDRPNDYEWESRARSRDDIDRDNAAWHAKRDWRNRTNPAGSHEHGYKKAFVKQNHRKIGFRR